jgi:hypothetical protein
MSLLWDLFDDFPAEASPASAPSLYVGYGDGLLAGPV